MIIFWDGRDWMTGKPSPDGQAMASCKVITPKVGDVVSSYFSNRSWEQNIPDRMVVVSSVIAQNSDYSTHTLA